MSAESLASKHCVPCRGGIPPLTFAVEADYERAAQGDEWSVPEVLEVTAESEDGLVMGLRHREHQIEGVQFHPESILTPEGPKIIENFLALTERA